MFFLGVDIGTGSVKAVLINADGDIIASAQKSYSISEPKPGYVEQDAMLVKQATFDVIKEITGKTDVQSKISSISFSAAMHSLLAVEKNNIPLTTVMLWADTRSRDEAETLKTNGLASEIYEQCGTPVHPMLPLTKLLWLKKNSPEMFVKADKFISLKEYICYEFTGKYIIDYSIASATGMFDIHQRKWNKKNLQIAGISSEQLSEPVPTTWYTTDLTSQIKKELNLPENIFFVIGSSDGCMANVGSGIIPGEDLAITIGTSAAVRITTSHSIKDEEQGIFNYVLDERLFISGGASNNGAILLDWLNKDLFKRNDITAVLRDAFSVTPGCDGLIFLPYLSGERAPVWDAGAKGIIYGLQRHHTQNYFARAAIEGITMNLYLIAEKLNRYQPGLKRIIASGGFNKSTEWLQLIADIFNMTVYSDTSADSSALGAAIWGGKSAGLLSDNKIASFIKNRNEYIPQKSMHDIYMSNYSIFNKLYATNKNLSR